MKRAVLSLAVGVAALPVGPAGPAEAEPRTRGGSPERLERDAPAESPRRASTPRGRTPADAHGATPLAFPSPALPILTPALRMQGLGLTQQTIETGPLRMEGLGYGGPE